MQQKCSWNCQKNRWIICHLSLILDFQLQPYSIRIIPWVLQMGYTQPHSPYNNAPKQKLCSPVDRETRMNVTVKYWQRFRWKRISEREVTHIRYKASDRWTKKEKRNFKVGEQVGEKLGFTFNKIRKKIIFKCSRKKTPSGLSLKEISKGSSCAGALFHTETAGTSVLMFLLSLSSKRYGDLQKGKRRFSGLGYIRATSWTYFWWWVRQDVFSIHDVCDLDENSEFRGKGVLLFVCPMPYKFRKTKHSASLKMVLLKSLLLSSIKVM